MALHNLPHSLTSFVGRERELAELARLLSTTRLLSLTGAGGVGKTRLALEVAAGVVDEFKDGVWQVELAALADPVLVTAAVAEALRIRERPDRPPLATLTQALRSKQALLLLDNCEHLVAACAELVEALLQACPRLRILVTSREALGIGGETNWRVPSLSAPAPAQAQAAGPSDLPALTQYEAVRLFLDRARAGRPGFALSERNASAVASICQRLDGIPLAIELAAARIEVLTAEQIAAGLDDRFRLLTGGGRTALPRHRTLWALVEWSYLLLTEPEQVLLRRLAVFAGGWTLEAAEAVCAFGAGVGGRESGVGDEMVPPTFDLLASLVRKSVVLADGQDGEVRYCLQETVRQYGLEKLREAGEEHLFRARHCDWFIRWGSPLMEALRGPEQATWFAKFDLERDNLRAALAWCAQGNGDVEAALGLCQSVLIRYWRLRGHLREGRSWVAALLALAPERSSGRAKGLWAAGALALQQSDYAAARPQLVEAIDLGREVGDSWVVAFSTMGLGVVWYMEGQYETAVGVQQEALPMMRELGDRTGLYMSLYLLAEGVGALGNADRAAALHEESLVVGREIGDPWQIARSLRYLGQVARERGDYAAARARCEESLSLCRGIGNQEGVAASLSALGDLALDSGDQATARAYFANSLTIWQELDVPAWVASLLECFARLAMARLQPERALRLAGAANRVRESVGAVLVPANRAGLDHLLDQARRTLAEETAALAWSEGRAMTMERAIAYAVEDAPAAPEQEPAQADAPRATAVRSVRARPQPTPLTRREQEVAALIARGLTNRQIGAELVIAERTVDAHVHGMLGKLGFASRAQIAAWAAEHGLLSARPK